MASVSDRIFAATRKGLFTVVRMVPARLPPVDAVRFAS